MFDNHGPGDPAAGIPHEIFEQGKFLRRQFDRPASARDPPLHPIQLQVFDREYGFQRQPVPPQKRPNPGRQFRK